MIILHNFHENNGTMLLFPVDVGLKYEPGMLLVCFCEIRPQITPRTLCPSRIYSPQLKAT